MFLAFQKVPDNTKSAFFPVTGFPRSGKIFFSSSTFSFLIASNDSLMAAAGISIINQVNFSPSHDRFIYFTCFAELEYRVSLDPGQNLCLLNENPAVSQKEREIRNWTIVVPLQSSLKHRATGEAMHIYFISSFPRRRNLIIYTPFLSGLLIYPFINFPPPFHFLLFFFSSFITLLIFFFISTSCPVGLGVISFMLLYFTYSHIKAIHLPQSRNLVLL